MKAFTTQAIKNYIEGDGKFCPNCESEELVAGGMDFDDLNIFAYWYCDDCKIHFTETYKLETITLDETI